jgi:predicted DNA-binding transcriptional regulator AlpA
MNALEALGMSSAIKDLPLSIDQKYEYVQKARKAILFLLHPDRGGRHEDFVRIESAIEPLKSQEGFDRALKGLNSSRDILRDTQLLLENMQLQRKMRELQAEKAALEVKLKQAAKKSNHKPLNNEKLLKIAEAARRLGVTQDWLYRNWKNLPFAVKLSPKQIRFSAKELEDYIQQHQP